MTPKDTKKHLGLSETTHANRFDIDHLQGSVAVPKGKKWLWRMLAFFGPAYMVAVGYIDPGNWATDIEGGARFGYALIWVILMSNLIAVLLQALAARLGVITGRDLAQSCRDEYGNFVRWVLYILCEIAIGAMDLAELLGTAIGLNLLLGIPLLWAVIITGLDVLLLLGLQHFGMRKIEAFIIALLAVIAGCFIVEMFLSSPSATGIASGFVPRPLGGKELYIAMGIIGATVMPHNLYLHSSIVKSRAVGKSDKAKKQACKYNFIDLIIALSAAFFINAAILILAASVFWKHGIVVTEIQQAHQMLDGLLGSKLAPFAFAIALLCAGQSSTLTGTLAGQITMEGFLHIKISPWLRRLLTRSLAIVPAIVVIVVMGDSGTYELLILSQVILSLQLSFAVVPLIRFTSSKLYMGKFVNKMWVTILAWVVAMVIITLNLQLVVQILSGFLHKASGIGWWAEVIPMVILGGGLVTLLGWLVIKPVKQLQANNAQ